MIICPKAPMECDKCCQSITREEQSNHLNNECPLNEIVCPNGCGKSIVRMEMNAHIESNCPNRMTECDKCGAKFQVKLKDSHNCVKSLKQEILGQNTKIEV